MGEEEELRAAGTEQTARPTHGSARGGCGGGKGTAAKSILGRNLLYFYPTPNSTCFPGEPRASSKGSCPDNYRAAAPALTQGLKTARAARPPRGTGHLPAAAPGVFLVSPQSCRLPASTPTAPPRPGGESQRQICLKSGRAPRTSRSTQRHGMPRACEDRRVQLHWGPTKNKPRTQNHRATMPTGTGSAQPGLTAPRAPRAAWWGQPNVARGSRGTGLLRLLRASKRFSWAPDTRELPAVPQTGPRHPQGQQLRGRHEQELPARPPTALPTAPGTTRGQSPAPVPRALGLLHYLSSRSPTSSTPLGS